MCSFIITWPSYSSHMWKKDCDIIWYDTLQSKSWNKKNHFKLNSLSSRSITWPGHWCSIANPVISISSPQHCVVVWFGVVGHYIFETILCHRSEGQDHPNDGHPLQHVLSSYKSTWHSSVCEAVKPALTECANSAALMNRHPITGYRWSHYFGVFDSCVGYLHFNYSLILWNQVCLITEEHAITFKIITLLHSEKHWVHVFVPWSSCKDFGAFYETKVMRVKVDHFYKVTVLN